MVVFAFEYEPTAICVKTHKTVVNHSFVMQKYFVQTNFKLQILPDKNVKIFISNTKIYTIFQTEDK